MNAIGFSFSDTIAGYVTSSTLEADGFGLRTADGREFRVELSPAAYAEVVRNLDEPFQDATGQMRELLVPGRYLHVHGIFYPGQDGHRFEAKRLIFPGREADQYRFEEPAWWIKQIVSLSEFYSRAQFGSGPVDYRNYRTRIGLNGSKYGDGLQETDTISRLIYGFASAYLLTGEERYLEVAERGTQYLHDHLRVEDEARGVVYWHHALDLQDGTARQILPSQFGDDYGSIPCYEQIYAIAGPTQTYRVNGDPAILRDIEGTVALFNRYYRDPRGESYFSHLDPSTFDPWSEALGQNRGRKNWNSVGDHAPAYLINLWLATGEARYAEMLRDTAGSIVTHFPDYDHSPFVQEKFHADWSHDTTWGWQQNRAVVGHNLKIAWNLMRLYHLEADERYVALAQKIGAIIPGVGSDQQRGGWYDVVERLRVPGEDYHRFVWHDRKAWWQQEQGILAYLILAGSLTGTGEGYRRAAREGAAFYNAFFLDHDDGAVYFNVLANGLPYLLGTERQKGSHSMSGYHAFELCYLATVYTNLLITKQPLDLYFKPMPGGFKDYRLRVSPDILPAGSVRIAEAWLDGASHADFDPLGLTVTLPDTRHRLTVKVRLVPNS